MNHLSLVLMPIVITVFGWLFVVWRVHFTKNSTRQILRDDTSAESSTTAASLVAKRVAVVQPSDAQSVRIKSELYRRALNAALSEGVDIQVWVADAVASKMNRFHDVEIYKAWHEAYPIGSKRVPETFFLNRSFEPLSQDEFAYQKSRQMRSLH